MASDPTALSRLRLLLAMQLPAFLDAKRQAEELVAELKVSPDAVLTLDRDDMVVVLQAITKPFSLVEAIVQRLNVALGDTRTSVAQADDLWPLIQEIERAAWSRSWTRLKKARRAMENATGTIRPSGSPFDSTDGATHWKVQGHEYEEGVHMADDRAKGQQKLHTIRNRHTLEERQVTQQEWRERGAQLRAEGFVRDDGGDEGEGEELPSEPSEPA